MDKTQTTPGYYPLFPNRFINPNGILFTPTAQINVSSILATTLDIKNSDFMQGLLRFQQAPDRSLATVENEGTLTVADGGFAALVAPGVANRGSINARLGTVVLGTGTEATLDFYGDGLFSFAVDPTLSGQVLGFDGKPLTALLSNSGIITADGGVVKLSAQVGSWVVNNVINVDGVIQARTVEDRQGEVVLSGGNSGRVAVSGTLDVSGQNPGETGGVTQVLGANINLAGNARLLASGDSGGGTILVGGDYQGKGDVPTALNTTVDKGVEIRTDALKTGNGGKAIVWASGTTAVNGLISATGGSTSGNGGLVETSGKAGLSIANTASVNINAANGTAGTWLLDPDRLFIDAGSTSNSLPGSSAGDFSVAASVVENALSTGNVTLSANNLIQIDSTINSSTQLNSNTLKFADQNSDGNLTVNLNAPILLASTPGYKQTLTGEATTINISQAFAGIAQNAVDLAATGSTLNFSGGTFTGTGDAVVSINKNLTILGQGAGNTIFDGESTRRVFNITAGTVNLDGFTIKNGNVKGNGAGIWVGAGSTVNVRNSTISGNRAIGDDKEPPNTTGFGGGIFSAGTATFINDIILGNIADFGGGGIINYLGTATLLNSIVSDNSVTANLGAGGIGNILGSLIINNSTISNNNTNGDFAAGLANGGGIVSISNSTFSGNNGSNFGAILNANLSLGDISGKGEIKIYNSTISGNTSNKSGGGIYNKDGSVTLVNTTITNNTAGLSGGGIYDAARGKVSISNSIVAGNIAPLSAEVDNNGTFNSLGFNLVGQNGSAGGFPTISTDIVLNSSVSSALSPLAYNGGFTQTHALVAGSPAIDAGSNALALDPITGQPLRIDQRGGERATTGLNAGSSVDIGAYEATSSTVVTNIGDDNSLGNLRTAVSFANGNLNRNPLNIATPAPNTIRFDTAGVFSNPQVITLRLGEITFNNPNTAINLQGTGASNLIISGNNKSRVFNIISGIVTLNGLTVTEGNAIDNGGGILVNPGSDLAINNSSILKNISSFYGGGIANINGLLAIENSLLSENSADTAGGIYNSFGKMTITNSIITKNIALFSSGGLRNDYGDVVLSNSFISKNIGNGEGGGGGVIGGSLTIIGSTISDNISDGVVGGLGNRSGNLSIINSTISGNKASSGSGLFNNSGNTKITNSTISNNNSNADGTGLLNINGGSVVITQSTLTGNSSTTGKGGGISNVSGSIDVVNSIVAGNFAPTNPEVSNTGTFNSLGHNLVGQNGDAGGFPTVTKDIVLKGSIDTAIGPLANNGGPTQTHAILEKSLAIDAGSVIPGITTDQRGAVRPQGNAPDIGAFESSFTRAPDVQVGNNDSSKTKVDTVNTNSQSKGNTSFPTVSTTITNISLTPQAGASTSTLDQYFSVSVAGYLGLAKTPGDTIDQAKNTLNQVVSQIPGVTPSLVYAYFAPDPSTQTASYPAHKSVLVASKDLSSGLPSNWLAQKGQTPSDKCSSEKPSRPSDPIWQLDSCGWDRIFPKGTAANDSDQLVLVLITSDGKVIRKRIVDATRGKVVKAVSRFRSSLQQIQTPEVYLPQSQQLYRWLVAPLEESFKAEKVNNLVFILEKGLRSLPLAALHDGKGFIVERYSVGLMPSLALTDTRRVNLQNAQVLAMGASQFKELSALPGVPLELSTINQLWSGQSLLNESFTPERLTRVRSSTSYGIVHLATHGEFLPGQPEQSYIQFWDRKVNLKQMQNLELSQPSPVSLLVLSACQTALGDQDAELGFTGLAVASGVQTALGGLWSISDLGTLGLMTSFYRNLKTAPTKSEALREAQVAMIRGQVRVDNAQLITPSLNIPLSAQLLEQKDVNLAHPYYWSGLTMVGNPW